MASQRSQGTSSPSASSIFLPLGRRGSRSSLSTQAEREGLNAALDQIHTAAYQSDSLTVFNDFTNPPGPTSATEEKSFSNELQGGLSGLYSRFRSSVGGVRDIVSGAGRSSERASIEEHGLRSPPTERSVSRPAHGSTGSITNIQELHPPSANGSGVQSPVSTHHPPIHDGYHPSAVGKSSKVSSKTPSISSKASASVSPAIKSPVPPLQKATTSSAAVDPTVTELHVSATKDPSLHSSNNSVTLPSHSFTAMDPASTNREEHPTPTSLTSSGWSQRLGTYSPVLQPKSQNHALEGSATGDVKTFIPSTHAPGRSDSLISQKTDPSQTASIQKPPKHSLDGSQDSRSINQDRLRSNSAASFNPEKTLTATGSTATSVSQLPGNAGNTFTGGQTPSTGATSVYLTDADTRSRESSKPSLRERSQEQSVLPKPITRPGLVPTESSVISPLGTPVDAERHDARGWRPSASEIQMPHMGSKLLSREFWMRDENSKDCFHCGEPFSTFRRKHHCRTCGQIFDSKCTLLIPGERFGQPGSIRVCKPCEAMINGHDDDSSEFSDTEQSPVVVNSRVSGLGSAAVDDDDASSVVSQPIDHVLKTPTMAIPATRRAGEAYNRRSTVLEISPERPLARPSSSRSLKSSLSGRTHSIGHKRHHSRQQFVRNFKPYHDDRAPFQRRNVDDAGTRSRLPAFHKDNIIDPDLAQYLSDDASSGDEGPSLLSAASDGSLPKTGADNERTTFGGFLAVMKKGRSAFTDRSIAGRDFDEGSITSSRAVNMTRTRRRNLSVASSVHRHSPRTSRDSVFNMHDASTVSHILDTVPPSGFKMTRSSSMRGAGAPPVEMNKASLHHVRKLLRQLLKDASVPHPNSWETALLPILLKAADEVDPDVQNGDDMDIRHYIKLKKISGGRPGDTSYVSGLVFTKNLALKSMPRSIPQPRILIIGFALEYARQQQHFMSLEPVIRQEREFLENLVSRISALRPNLLLVEKNVSGLALELLEKAHIATAYNVKSSVLEAVSRCTQTKIITSMDKLVTTPVTSDCGSFDVKTYVPNGRKKTYMYLSGCRKELGCTIVLRGSDNEVLGKVKRITEFMAYVVYNLRLETCLMRDAFAKIPMALTAGTESNVDNSTHKSDLSSAANSGDKLGAMSSSQESDDKKSNGAIPCRKTVASEVTEVPDYIPMPTYYQDIVRDHETKILSASPFVKFEPPYLLARAREMERRLAYLRRVRDQDVDIGEHSEEKAKPQKFVLITPEMVHDSPHGAPPKVKEILYAAHDAEYDRALHHYQTQKRQWEAYIAGTVGLFDPYAHQKIVVLYSLVCTTSSIPCSGPDLLALEYYNEHGNDTVFDSDCTLGQFVEDICLNATAICNVNGCEKRMLEHHRQYVHGEAQISVFTLPYPSKLRGFQDTILMWSACKICGNETQVFPMSEGTWKYSLGKYLELSFWSKNLHARAGVCPHDLQRDHLRYFGFKDVAIRIHYDPINLLEIIVPRTRVTWKVDNDLNLKNEVYVKMEQRLSKFMHSVKLRLKGISVESVIPKLAEDCKKQIEILTKKANDDHTSLVKQLQDKYIGSRYWTVIPFNEVLRSVQEKVVEWDTAFAEFEMSFFPSEKDIRRLATLQLKKIFLDKDTSVTSLASTDEAPTTPTEVESENSEKPEHIRPMRRMTLSPEKAQDVLVSVVEEHAGDNKSQKEEPSKIEEIRSTAPSPSPDGNASSPPHSEIDAARENEMQHLDLATSSSHPERSSLEMKAKHTADVPQVSASSDENSGTAPGSVSARELSPKSLKTGHATNVPMPTTPSHPPSGIPRRTEGAARRSGKATSPPLLRAQSQPSHLQKVISNDSSVFKPIRFGSSKTSGPEGISKVSEKKLADRLGLGALRSSKLTPGPSLIPRSIPSKRPSRVSYLAKHFEQLSREFEKERQRERAQRAAKGTHSRAYPLASSKPIVEVYKNVREAVEEREPSGEGEDLMQRVPVNGSSRGSDEFPKRPFEDETRKEPRPEELTECGARKDTNAQIEEQSSSDGEGEEGRSEEDRASADGLHVTESNEELPKMSPDEEQMDLKELPKHERSTLLKMLTNFWSERSASGWTPLDYPLTMSDHIFADCDIVVREDEPSSLVAFALDSQDYKEKLAGIQRRYEELDTDLDPLGDPVALNEARIEHALLRSTGTHLKYQFQEGQAKMLCKVFYAEQFDALRKKCGVAERIVESLSRCAKWDSKGGKTKSLFLKTLDDRFILKSLATIETQAFLKFAPAYFQIMSEALFHELPSAIAKMFGFYQVIIKNPVTGAEFNWYLLLMENLFYDRVPTRIFDLKGSMRNRKVESTGERDEVLLDENMVDFIYETPLFVREHSKKLLSQSVWNDTLFLGRQNVMDYSLMIAIDESRSELVVGIIDCIRTYTWDKKLESWIKDRGFAGGGKNRPTVTSPKEYKSRFREAMARYVLQAPSCWHQFQPSQMYRYAPVEQLPNVDYFGADGDAGEMESVGS
ncbi:1-phosphatidylinositol-3-phosphate 5-kinase [Aspergillus nanangensis]|uniref:1-phosphatidylinositol-3-phosphate 5-kinase n=1 Tax=Aspergillus nanangensis TaxID=2582783 RepID=A0AAD4CEC7_ASPNN|nr:1-phosphatidylinositol-3-phosphate 5-kinase [Aspergillus nanangensis]